MKTKIDTREELVLAYIAEHGTITSSKLGELIADEVKRPRDVGYYTLNRMREQGKLRLVRGGVYGPDTPAPSAPKHLLGWGFR